MRHVTLCLLLWSIGASPNGEASAQAAAPSLQDQINAASRILVRTATGRGELSRPRLAGDSLGFATGWVTTSRSGLRTTLESPLPFGAVSEIAVPAGTNAGKGAAIGGGIGALLGLVLVAGASTEEGSFQPSGGEYAAAFAVTTALGAGLGALLGAASTKWRVIYPAPPGSR